MDKLTYVVLLFSVDLANYSGVGNCMTVKFRNGKYYQPTHCNNLYFHVCQECKYLSNACLALICSIWLPSACTIRFIEHLKEISTEANVNDCSITILYRNRKTFPCSDSS